MSVPGESRTDKEAERPRVEINRKKLFVVGDRVLVAPESGEDRTRVGLLLPATAVEKMAVQGGRVMEVGPGTPVPNPADFGDEPWKVTQQGAKARYMPMEARVGDFALFLRNAAVEIEFERTKYLIVPHAAILLLVRDDAKDPEEFREEHFKL
jgi:co-chaperonin GroES (HSP10)